MANRTAIVIAPGSGFHILCIDSEGIDVGARVAEKIDFNYKPVFVGEKNMLFPVGTSETGYTHLKQIVAE